MREAHAAAEAAAQRAEEANRIKDEFLSIVSHELRTPLNAMMGWASILLGGGAAEARLKRGLEVIYRNALAQSKLIDDMLDVARIVAGKISLEPRPLDLVQVVRDAIASLEPKASAKAQSLRLSGDDTPLPVVGDPVRLQQVFWNLLHNATKFTPENGLIEVTLHADAKNVCVNVQDSGPGIDPAFRSHLFEPFRQADSGSSRRSGGLGLGLAIVRHIVTLHGGEVRADDLGASGGSLFVVRFQRADAAPKPEAADHLRGESRADVLRGRRILVVDDNRDSLEMLSVGLTELGCVVDSVDSAEEALKRVGSFHPDVLVSDLGMPGKDGFWLIREVRKQVRGTLSAVALSAYTQATDLQRSAAAGFDAHLGKPVRLEQLASLLAEWCRLPRGGR